MRPMPALWTWAGEAAMTTIQLLLWICAALLLQVAAGIGVLVWRRPAQAAPALHIDAARTASPSAAAWPGWRDFRVTSRSFEDVANSQCSFHLQPVDGAPLAAFKPGQYLTFSLQAGVTSGGVAVAGPGLIRCYSLSDRPDDTGYRITVKRVPAPADRPDLPPGVSSAYFHDRLQVGDILRVKAPSGHFVIDADASVPAVFIAGGIGITPLLSMLRWCIAEQPGREIQLFYGVRNRAEHAFKAVLEDLVRMHPAVHLYVVYASPAPDDVQGRDYLHTGYISLELLRSTLAHGRHHFYVCGPPPMMQSLVPALREWGVQEDDIRFEAFGPASARPAGPVANEPLLAPSMALEVRLRRAARTLVWDGQDANLLDFLERHGVAVESGCRTGSCGTCETRLVSGSLHYADKPDHDIASGCCLPCVGAPRSALVLDA
jgi:ferredoxin-NADP reductase